MSPQRVGTLGHKLSSLNTKTQLMMKIKSSTQTPGGDNKIIKTYSGLLFVSANYLTKVPDILIWCSGVVARFAATQSWECVNIYCGGEPGNHG